MVWKLCRKTITSNTKYLATFLQENFKISKKKKEGKKIGKEMIPRKVVSSISEVSAKTAWGVRTRWFPVVLCPSPWRSCLWRAWQRSGPWGVLEDGFGAYQIEISKNIIRISRYLQRFCWSYGELVITSSVKCLTSNFARQLVNYNDTLQNYAPSTWNRES